MLTEIVINQSVGESLLTLLFKFVDINMYDLAH